MSTPEQDQYLHEHFGVDVAKHRATPVPGSAVSRASPAGDSLVPVLEIPSVPRVMLGVGESVPLKFRIQNYSDLPKWAHIDWWVNPDGDSRAVNLSEKFNGGEATVTVTAVHAGKATIQAAVKFGTDVATETYRFEDTVFVVKADNFVPVLEIPSVPRVMLGVGESLPLKFRIQNHGDLPKGTNIDWWVNPDGDGRAVNLSGQKFNGGEATVTVTAAHAGKATIQAAVKVRSDDAAVDYRFEDTVFVVKEASQLANPNGQGGVANATNLETEMGRLLDQWHGAAKDGVTEFITGALNKRINDLASGSAGNFVQSLLGNLVWAAACFPEAKAVQFAISVMGVAIGAAPAVPKKVDGTLIPDIQKAMIGEINAIFQQNDGALRNKAQALLKSEPGITLYEALALFVEASFKNQYFSVDASGTSAPKLNLDAIAATIAAEAQKKLDEAIAAEKERRLEEMRKTLQIPRPPEEA